MNRGLILEPVLAESLLRGNNLPVRNESGNWEPYLPKFEAQSKFGLETMNCVQYSFLSVLEMIAASYGRTINFSDRYLYWASGCTELGNTYSRCLSGFKRHWAPDERLWPWLVPLTREEYGAEPPEDVREAAAAYMSEWTFAGVSYVEPYLEDLKEALKSSPIWFCNSTHSMVIYAIDDRIRVWDTYGDGKVDFPLDYCQHIYAAYNVAFMPKEEMPMPSPKFTENTLYQLVDSPGGFYLFAKGRMYSDRVALLLSSWVIRNKKHTTDENGVETDHFSGGPVGTLRAVDLQGVKLYTLKDVEINLGGVVE